MKLVALLALVAMLSLGCSKKCDPNDLTTWDESCVAQGGGGGSGAPVITTNTTPAPGLPSAVTVRGSMLPGTSVRATSNGMWFLGSVESVTFEPSLVGTQLNLTSAASFSMISPSPGGCSMPNGFGHAGVATNVISIVTDTSQACQDLLVAMKVDGFTVEFTGVPANTGGTVARVSYIITP